jgi:hypothetical protein
MSSLALREQLRVARACRTGVSFDPHEIHLLEEELDAARQAEIELASDIADLHQRLRRLRHGMIAVLLFIALVTGLHGLVFLTGL